MSHYSRLFDLGTGNLLRLWPPTGSPFRYTTSTTTISLEGRRMGDDFRKELREYAHAPEETVTAMTATVGRGRLDGRMPLPARTA